MLGLLLLRRKRIDNFEKLTFLIMELKNKVAIITGSGVGIGRAIALAFADEGANVVVCSRTEKDFLETKRLVEKNSVECLALKCDVSKITDVKNLIKKTVEKFGRIDVLVNNAAILGFRNLEESTIENIDREIDINLKGVFYCMRESLPYLKKSSGIIINISSGAGKHGFPGSSVYCATKFAVLGLTESLGQEFENVNVYAVCPGPVNTRMYRIISGEDADLSGIRQPEEVARVVVDVCRGKIKLGSGGNVDVR